VFVFVCVGACVFLCLRTGRGRATSWSPAQGVLPTVQDIENRSETESFMEVGQGPNWGCSAKEKNCLNLYSAFGLVKIFLFLLSHSRRITLVFNDSRMRHNDESFIIWRVLSHVRPCLPSGLLPSGFPTKTLHALPSHACYIPNPSQSPWPDHSDNIWRGWRCHSSTTCPHFIYWT
jgi:hypothetical protein